MNDNPSFNMLPFGLLELDVIGTAIRYSPPAEQNLSIASLARLRLSNRSADFARSWQMVGQWINSLQLS